MAVIHSGRNPLPGRRRAALALAALCLPAALASAAATVWIHIDQWPVLLTAAGNLRDAFVDGVVAPAGDVTFAQPWLTQLWQIVPQLLQGASWLVYGLALALPGLLGTGLCGLFGVLFRPAVRRYRALRERSRGERDALTLLRKLPDACHIFLYKGLRFDDEDVLMDAVLIGPGGMAVVETVSGPGLVEGCVTDRVLRRRLPDGTVDKLNNPARRVTVQAKHLRGYLKSVGLDVWIDPCVLFAHPEASAYVSVPEEAPLSSRLRLADCMMMDAGGFWDALGRGMAGGNQLNADVVRLLAAAVDKAPAGRRRGQDHREV